MNPDLLKRYIPPAVWFVAVLTILFVPFKIISLGFLPMDDALRHAAKAVSEKSWQDILLMRSDFAIDPSPGWQKILEWVYQASWVRDWANGPAEALVIFSAVSLMLLVTLCGLPWLRRPEAWLGALLAAAVFAPACTTRFMRGRPYLLTDFVVMTILLLWSRQAKDSPRRMALIFTPLLVAASAWIHGSWYMLVLPGAAILFAGYWRSALAYGGCWLTGSLLGCSLTGHPFEFLFQSVRHMFEVFGNSTVNRQLESEFYPSNGETAAVLLVIAFLFWRVVSNRAHPGKFAPLLNPIFVMMVMGWLLGLKMQRFWWDYGIPAFILWIAFELQAHFENGLGFDSAKRLFITLGLAAGVYLGFTSDRDGRWTENLTTEFLTPDNPALAGWLPDPGGIIYNSDMDVFFETFYKNPHAPWRYALGFEPGLMLPDNLAVLRKAQWNFGDSRAYEPWVEKMRPEDRLIIHATGGARPNLPALEWNYAATEIWIGRLPRPGSPSPAQSPR
ncbi:MAG TPA: hypothetical protein VNZ25_08460 [Candidatus Angelobacter sp.]|nr:hypothetical protein [Candidatus Angelobacter sp.]